MERVERMEGQIHVGHEHLSKPSGKHNEMPVDCFETDRYVVVHVDLAGCKVQNLKVSAHDDVLDVQAERSPGEEYTDTIRRYYKQEISSGTLWREIKLPAKVGKQEPQAFFANGMLTVVIPQEGHYMGEPKKPEQDQGKR